jgi:undecaprenyl diphosphate synthase
MIDDAIARTSVNSGPVLAIALNYGAQAELVEATKRLAMKVAAGEMTADGITPEAIEGELQTNGLPPLDLVIRTSGEQSVNFLLWQAAYAELMFVDTLWPDFDEAALADAVAASDNGTAFRRPVIDPDPEPAASRSSPPLHLCPTARGCWPAS